MPISPPTLDDRGYEDLLADLLARIPAHTPEWTFARTGDPGRTLLELFAWLGDTLLYRVNLIPEKQRLAFLRLLGLEPRPALPATGIVSVAFDSDKVEAPLTLPAGALIQGPSSFETRRQLTVLPVIAETYVKRPIREDERVKLAPLLGTLPQVYGLAQETPKYYVTTPVFVGGAAEVDGIDLSEGAGTLDGCLWIALFAPKSAAPGEDPVAAVKQALAPDRNGVHTRITIGVAPALTLGDPLDAMAAASVVPKSAQIPVVWEVTSGREGSDMFVALDPEDGTAGLTRTGVVTLTLPAVLGAPENDVRNELLAGVGDRPPRLDDDDRAKRLVAWVRLRMVRHGEAPPPTLALSWAGFGAVEIDQRKTTFGRQIGESTGLADQVFSLGATSVEPETLVIEVAEEGRRFEAWARVADLALAGHDETVYALRAEEGTITFGDGARGKVPPERARIRVARMRAGGGEAGNLPPRALKELRHGNRSFKVTQGLALRGGRDAEALDEAEKRIPAILRHRERAVTEDDFRALASVTPGVSVGRVEVLPRFSPKRRASGIPGIVTVMALPSKLGVLPPAPRADRVFLERVFAYLDPRRLLSTELYVIGCEYVSIGVSVAIVVRQGLEESDVLAAVRAALRVHLWPLAPHGPSGAGWPLGGTVRARELEVLVARVEGVEGVSMPRLFRREKAGAWKVIAAAHACDPTEIPLEKWQLPELCDVVAVVGTDSPELLDPRGGGTPGPEIGIPVVPEVC
jgi:predicted phage baseplate assembly protein